MTMTTTGGPLRGYRVLDLADEMAALCGKMFADLGADVIKVEPPAGCPTRSIPPLLDDGAVADRSCYFLATAAGKRSVTLDLEQAQGREFLARLAEGADFLIESFPLGYLDGLGLSYETLAMRNPRLIYTSVTPFGDLGPAATWKAADIVGWAAGGMMAMMGEPGRPPLQVSVPQACSHAGSEAAVASMLAHLDRARSGLGQKVVVSMQAAGVWATNSETAFPALADRSLERSGIVPAGGSRSPLYHCADGYVQLLIGGGIFLSTTTGLLDWAREFGPLPPAVRLTPPFAGRKPGINRSQYFGNFNSSKKSISIDMTTGEGRGLVRQLVPQCEVVAESFRVGTMAKWGLGYEQLWQLRPDLSYLATCLQGQSGPKAGFAGFGMQLAAIAGFYHLSGYSGDELTPPHGPYTDFIAPRFGCFALLSALDYRRRTGEGQMIDLSQYEASLHFLAPAITHYFATGTVAQPVGNGSTRYAPHGSYRCRDEAGKSGGSHSPSILTSSGRPFF